MDHFMYIRRFGFTITAKKICGNCRHVKLRKKNTGDLNCTNTLLDKPMAVRYTSSCVLFEEAQDAKVNEKEAGHAESESGKA